MARPEGLLIAKSFKPRQNLRFTAYLGNDISDLKCAGSGADGLSTLSGKRGRPGDVTLEESAENLEGQRDVVKRRAGLV